jgi:hypothetical protein
MRFAISRTCESMRLKAKLGFVVAGLCLGVSSFGGSTPAQAGVFSGYNLPPFICSTGVGCCAAATMPALIHQMFSGTGMYAGQQDLQQYYYTQTLWPKIQAALKSSADEARNVMLMTIGPRGSFIDAQTLSQTLTSLQRQEADSTNNEGASDQICRFGTLSTSLAKSDDKSRVVQLGLANQMLQRDVMRSGLASAFEAGVGSKLGRSSDKDSRTALYKKVYCDPKHSGGSDGGDATCAATSDKRQNRDIDSTRSLYNPLTLNLDFADDTSLAAKTDDEENLMSLASNLFAHNLPINMGIADFNAMVKDNGKASDSRKEKLMDYRALTAKRSVAQNSFAALAAMKAAGSGGSSTYMKQMVNYLGLDAAAQTAYLGDNPSYYAQMELLTRKLYQSPAFYANLMESPANVARQQTAMEGIGLMQDRDTYESLRRSEMVLSTLLEVYIAKAQDKEMDRGTKSK